MVERLEFEDAKDPDEVLDFTIHWQDRIGDDDTMIDHEIIGFPQSDVTLDSTVMDPEQKTVTIWLSGGTIPINVPSVNLDFTCRVMTSGGRTYDQTCRIKLRVK